MAPSTPTLQHTKLPRRIGRYDVVMEIGAGGMARLYLGVQRGPFEVKKLVAVKELRQELTSDPYFLAMFVDEARIAARLNHPNVVHTYEVLDEAPNFYIVMEFLDGQSLLDVLRRVGRAIFPLHEHVWILTQLLAGLQYAHDLCDYDGTPLQILHRDVTPSNVFLCRSGETKLLDFGIANVKGALAASVHGMVRGKRGYLAPEQQLGQPASVQTDLYSVGVMLWEAVARTRRVASNGKVQGPAIEEVCASAPAALVAILSRALATKPEDRHPSARAFQRELEQFLKSEKSQVGPESVSRLLQTYFEEDRRELYRAVQFYTGAHAYESSDSGLSVAPTNRPTPTGEDITCELSDHDHRDEEAQTLESPVDRLLLRATRGEPDPAENASLWPSVGAAWAGLQSLRWPPVKIWMWPVAVGLVALVAVTTFAILARISRPHAGQIDRPQIRTDLAASTRDGPAPGRSGAGNSPTATLPAIRREPIPIEAARPALGRPRSPAPPTRDHAPVSDPPRTGRSASKPSSHAPSNGPQHIDPASLEPGMDFPEAATPRNQAQLDFDNPYD